ncbi:MAG: hypothetical protein PHC97_02085 [Patescibacteria group bacterium]|nr:hypothetical protein [Patescibacteria group bacterium]
MYQTTSDKIKTFLLNLITKYIVWIIIAVVIIIWWLFPDMTMTLAKILLLYAPATVLFIAFILAMTRIGFRSKRDEERGIGQYEIIVTKWDFYLIDFIIYGGSLLILAMPFIVNEKGVGVTDLLQTVAFFVFANWLKTIFLNKIPK